MAKATYGKGGDKMGMDKMGKGGMPMKPGAKHGKNCKGGNCKGCA